MSDQQNPPSAAPRPADDLGAQRDYWDAWNAAHREQEEDRSPVSKRQREIILEWLGELGRTDLNILEVGCGAGWMAPDLLRFGALTATDLSVTVVARAQERNPAAKFQSGDFMALDFGDGQFDVVVSLEVLSHVSDHAAFIAKIARHLKPGGLMMLATQNRPVLEKHNNVAPPKPGNLRKWFDAAELRALVQPHFNVLKLFSVAPQANRGIMRIVNSERLNKPIRLLFGNRVELLKERLGLGWVLMLMGRKQS